MPPPRKVDLLPSEFKSWLNEALKERGFSGYEELAEDLNFKLAEEGFELRIQKSALHTYGKEYSEFIKHQEEASAWAAGWMQDNGLEEEAQRHNVLFQMVTTLAFKSMQSQMTKDGDDIDPRELHFIGKMLKDIMASSGIRQKMLEDERERIIAQERAAMAAKLDQAVAAGDAKSAAAQTAREILGFEDG